MIYCIQKTTNLVEPSRHIITKITDQDIPYHIFEAIHFAAVLYYYLHHISSGEFPPIAIMDTASQRKEARGHPL